MGEARKDTGLESDHFPIVGTANFSYPIFEQKWRNGSWKGWQLTSDREHFHRRVMEGCGFDGGFPADLFWATLENTSLAQIESLVKLAVMNSEFETTASLRKKRRQMPVEVKNEKEKIWLLDGEARKQQKKEYIKKRGAWQREGKVQSLRAISDNKRRQQTWIAPSVMKVDGVMTGDREIWKEGLYRFIYKRYHLSDGDNLLLIKDLESRRQVGFNRRADGEYLPGIGFKDVIFARAAISTNTAGGKDGLVGEIWKDMPYAMMVLIWIFFKLRAEYGRGDVGEAWRIWGLIGLPKVRKPSSFQIFATYAGRLSCRSGILSQCFWQHPITENRPGYRHMVSGKGVVQCKSQSWCIICFSFHTNGAT